MTKVVVTESTDSYQDRTAEEKITHWRTDNDYKRLTLYTNHPVSGEEMYWEFDKHSTDELLTQESDGSFSIESDQLDYIKDLWEVKIWDKEILYYQGNALFKVPTETDIPAEWLGECKIIAKETAMWDEVYVNKELVKIDYQIGCTGPEGEEVDALITKINSKFSNQPNFKAKSFNIVGKYFDNHTIRPPYSSNNTVTFYEMYYDKAAYSNLLATYKVPVHSYSFRWWYGKKYDLDSSKEYLKVVIVGNETTDNYQTNPDSFIMRPPLPVCYDHYFAKIYDINGVEADEYDVFFTSAPNIMKKYCEKYSLEFPLPDNKMQSTVWNFGLVYDKNTLAIKQVKAYIKIPQTPANWLI